MLTTAVAAAIGLANLAAIEPEDEHPKQGIAAPVEAKKLEPRLRVRVTRGRITALWPDGSSPSLSVSPELQRAAFRWLRAAQPVSAAAILVHVPTAQVLVWQQYHQGRDEAAPLTDLVPAASLFKLVTATALLEHSPVVPGTRVCIEGGERRVSHVHLLPARGPNAHCDAFGRALGFSRNAVFAQLATRYLNAERLEQVAQGFGFNAPVAFEVPELFGQVRVPREPLAFARTAAGFVNSRISPLGVTLLSYAIARGGIASRLTLLADRGEAEETEQRRVMQPSTAARLAQMMEVTVHSGTSLQAFSDERGRSYLGNIRVAGKTGTLRELPQDLTTSWFTGFAPSRNPEVVVTVLLQNGPAWRKKANQVARDLLRAYFVRAPGVSAPD